MSFELHLGPDTYVPAAKELPINIFNKVNTNKTIFFNSRCWIPDERQGWLPVNVLDVSINDNGKSTIHLVSDLEPTVKFKIESSNLQRDISLLPQLRNLTDDVDDLTNLSHLNEASVLNSVKIRYANKRIYTYSGIVLIAMNPFESVDHLYSLDKINQYQNKPKSENPPHLFSIANDSYKIMKSNGESQSIIVSGESGAGKTVSAKYIMRFFANANPKTTSQKTLEIEKQILATNPIMEAFGNAKTTRNDNSSRFGKYLQIQFDNQYSICGANIKTYLLERSRLVHQQNMERNYHIFYQMVKGLPEKTKAQLGLKNAQDYNYLYQGETSVINGVDDAKSFQETCEALELIGIDSDTQFQIFKILSALLHIGNIEIQKSRDTGSIDCNDPHLQLASDLLGINPNEFSKWIVKKKIATRSDSIVSHLKYHESIVSRDSVSKHIYSSLFNWLCEYINQDLSSDVKNVKSFIGVLDIYGFEHFDTNSFEQFCINYANEKLQQEFTEHVFKLQQEEYKDEGIEWSFIEFSDNQPCIDLIESRSGILSLLDEQCQLPSGSEKAWTEKMFQSLTQPPYSKVFKKARFGDERFIVSHYALDVPYTIEGFLEKNRDAVSEAQTEVLKSSSNQFLLDILNVNVTPKSPTSARRAKKPTLGSIFKSSLSNLMSTINSTDVHYIRCIKPNETKTAWEFENLMVLSQLRACGVLETIKISMVGFQSKSTYNEFLKRFLILLPDTLKRLKIKTNKAESIAEEKVFTKEILDLYINKSELYQMGKTKIFFKAGVLSELEILKTKKVRESTIILQKYLRGYHTRLQYTKLKIATLAIQTSIRGLLARMEFARKEKSILLIQSFFRGALSRAHQKQSITLLNDLKYIHKGSLVRKDVHTQLIEKARVAAELEAARILQEEEKLKQLEIEKAQEKAMNDHETRPSSLTASQVKVNNDSPELKKLKQNNRMASVNLHGSSEETLEKIESPTTSPDEFSKLESDFASLPQIELTEQEAEIFQNNEPKEAMEIALGRLISKMEKVSLDTEESHADPEGDIELNSAVNVNFERDVFIYLKALENVEFEETDDESNGNDGEYAKVSHTTSKHRFSSISKHSGSQKTSSKLAMDEDACRRNYQTALVDIEKLMTGPKLLPRSLASLLTEKLPPPLGDMSQLKDISQKNILLPAKSINEVLRMLWRKSLDGQSVIFLHYCVENFQNLMIAKSNADEIITYGTYLMSNLDQISKFITESRNSLMYDLFSVSLGDSNRRSDLMRLQLMLKRYFEGFFSVAYISWMKVLLGELEKRCIDAVIFDIPLSDQEKSTNFYFNKMASKGSRYKMHDLLTVFNNFQLSMKLFHVKKVVQNSIIYDLLSQIDALIFNELISKDKILTYQIGNCIKSNLTSLIDWCHNKSIPDSPEALQNSLAVCQILMLKKAGQADPSTISKICECMSTKQVDRILNDCFINDGELIEPKELKKTTKFNIPNDKSLYANQFLELK